MTSIEIVPVTVVDPALVEAVRHTIVGMLTLVTFRIARGLRAWIEDVVVSDSARGRGVGEALSRAAIERARDQGAPTASVSALAWPSPSPP